LIASLNQLGGFSILLSSALLIGSPACGHVGLEFNEDASAGDLGLGQELPGKENGSGQTGEGHALGQGGANAGPSDTTESQTGGTSGEQIPDGTGGTQALIDEVQELLFEKNVLMISDSDRAVDNRIEEHLVTLGANVERVVDSAFTAEMYAERDLVILSPTADDGVASAEFAKVESGLLVLELHIIPELGLGEPREELIENGSVVVQSPDHPVAFGSQGDVQVCEEETLLTGHLYPEGVTPILVDPENPELAFVIVAEENTVVNGEPLKGPRAAVSHLDERGCETEATWLYLDSTIVWLLNHS